MIQSVIIFLLGFLCAAFIALLALPPVWRRAVRLTRRAIEASMPLSRQELLASRDQVRAEYAMAVRRVEMQLSEVKEKSAGQAVELSRNKRKLNRLESERDRLRAQVAELETMTNSFREDVAARDELIRQFTERSDEAEKALAERIGELKNLGELFEETKITSTARQVELLTSQTELERLGRELAKLQRERTQAVKKLEIAELSDKTVNESIEYERRRVRELQDKLDRTIADISDRDDKIARREREIERLKAKSREIVSEDEKVQELQAENRQLTEEVGHLQARLEESDARLRETMQDLAARMVAMTAQRESQRQPIMRALEKAAPQFPDRTSTPPPSLEERIRRISGKTAELS